MTGGLSRFPCSLRSSGLELGAFLLPVCSEASVRHPHCPGAASHPRPGGSLQGPGGHSPQVGLPVGRGARTGPGVAAPNCPCSSWGAQSVSVLQTPPDSGRATGSGPLGGDSQARCLGTWGPWAPGVSWVQRTEGHPQGSERLFPAWPTSSPAQKYPRPGVSVPWAAPPACLSRPLTASPVSPASEPASGSSSEAAGAMRAEGWAGVGVTSPAVTPHRHWCQGRSTEPWACP